MAAPDLTSTAISAGKAVGRAFSVVSLLPALFLVGLVWTLVASHAFGGRPDPGAVVRAGQAMSIAGAGLLLLTAFALGYVLHPMQFALTQLLEGYWGTSESGIRLMVVRARRYRRTHWRLRERLDRADLRLKGMDESLMRSPKGDRTAMPDLIERQQVAKALGSLPVHAERIMPTRLGNVLRRHEDLAGEPYGLPGVTVIPPLTLVASDESNRYLADSTEQLDTAVSVCAVTAMATALVAGATLTDGWWLLTALIPYGMCYFAYLGAISAGTGYGLAMRHMVDLDRFSLYREMHLQEPSSLAEERQLADQVRLLLDPPATLLFTRSGKPIVDGNAIGLSYVTVPPTPMPSLGRSRPPRVRPAHKAPRGS